MQPGSPGSVGIVGVGTMGRQVAWACAVNGLETRVFDASDDQRRSAERQIHEWLADGSLTADEIHEAKSRLRFFDRLETALDGVDLGFENVPEVLELKQAVHAQIDAALPAAALQGSNASSLTGSAIARDVRRRERFFCMNFSLPRYGQGYVELMGTPETSAETLESARAWARRIRMIPLTMQREIMGYAMNRIWRAIKKEALFLVDEGYASVEHIDRAFMLFFGIDWGPFGLMDRVSLDSILKVEERYYDASADESDRPARVLVDMVARGDLGEKTGHGFYSWPDAAYLRPGWLEYGGDARGPDR